MIKRLIGSILDEVVAIGIGAVLLFIFEGILRIAGFQMVREYWATFAVVALAISNIVYFSLGEESLGKRVLK